MVVVVCCVLGGWCESADLGNHGSLLAAQDGAYSVRDIVLPSWLACVGWTDYGSVALPDLSCILWNGDLELDLDLLHVLIPFQ